MENGAFVEENPLKEIKLQLFLNSFVPLVNQCCFFDFFDDLVSGCLDHEFCVFIGDNVLGSRSDFQ